MPAVGSGPFVTRRSAWPNRSDPRRDSVEDHSAVDVPRLPGDTSSGIGNEEAHEICDVDRLRGLAERHLGHPLLHANARRGGYERARHAAMLIALHTMTT